MSSLSDRSFGLGLRPQHYPEFEAGPQRVDFLEIISENYMGGGGRPRRMLERVRADHPLVMHGVSLSIGSFDGPDPAYLDALAALVEVVEPLWVSDHLCWTGVLGRNSHDLLPLPYDRETLDRVVQSVTRVQERLGRRILLENPSSYALFEGADMGEAEFLAETARRADCDILLDVNNVFVSAHNHGFDSDAYVAALPAGRIRQIHLAGHSVTPVAIIDTHDAPITDPVLDLYERVVARIGPRPTMIERDDAIPPLADLLVELDRVRDRAQGAAAA